MAKALPIGMTVYTAENAVSQMRYSPDATGSAFRRIRATRPEARAGDALAGGLRGFVLLYCVDQFEEFVYSGPRL